MQIIANRLFAARSAWLKEQVDVEFPTAESLRGRDIYLEYSTGEKFYELTLASLPESGSEVILPVSFHRMTIFFALLQAERFTDGAESADVVEFLTQIIYSEPCQLYLAFSDGEAVAAAIVTLQHNALLISDVYMKTNPLFDSPKQWVEALAGQVKSQQLTELASIWWAE